MLVRSATAIVVTVGLLLALTPTTSARAQGGEAGLLDPSSLELHDGDLTVTDDGAVVENLEIRGTLRIRADDVRVRNVWVYTSSFWTIYVESGSATLEHLEIGHPDHVGQRGVGGSNVVGRFLDIHHVEDGIKLSRNVLYENVRVHDLDSASALPHADAVQDDGGSQNAIVRNSSLDSTGPLRNGNAAVIIKSDLGVSKNITFSGNYLNGGNFVVFVNDGGHGMPANVSFVDNRIGPDSTYGLLKTDGPVGWTGNVWADTGAPAIPGDAPQPSTSAPPTTVGTTTTVAPSASDPLTTSSAPSESPSTSSTSPAAVPPGPSTSEARSRPGNGSGEVTLGDASTSLSDETSVPIAIEEAGGGRGTDLVLLLPLVGLGLLVAASYLLVRRRRTEEGNRSEP